jgi:4'-phosphopantetheinyl transferase
VADTADSTDSTDTAQVWWARPQDANPALAGLLDDVERGRWTAYRRDQDRQRFLVGCSLAKTVVARLTGQDPAQVTLDRTCPQCGKPHGKPRLAESDLELSVSHSGDRIAVAAMTGHPVGVDVEQLRDTHDRESLERYVMAETETGDLFVAWTRKEAVTKATGDGLRVSFKEVVLAEDPLRVAAWPYPAPPESVTLFDLDPGPGYVAALAVIGDCGKVVSHDGTALLAENIGCL